MQIKTLTLLLLCAAICNTGILSAQTTATTTTTTTVSAKAGSQISWRKDKKKAKKLLKKNETEAAIPYLEDGLKQKPKKKFFAQKLAPAELEIRDYKAANKYYHLLVQQDSLKHKKPAYIFQYALTQKYLGQYEEAKANFAKFKKTAGDDDESTDLKKRATREIAGCEKGVFFRDSVPAPAFKVKHLDANVNQAGADFAPRLRDNSLYYSSVKGDGASALSRIYKSLPQGKNWGAGEAISDNINVAGKHVGNGSFSKDGNTLYYTECQTGSDNKIKCQIYKSSFVNGTWEKGTSVGAAVNDPLYTSTQPAVGLNKDGEDVVYFVSDRNSGKGLDIFFSKINADGTLAKPRSVGPQINSKGDEATPYFDFASKTLYFSSNGLVNIGGFDVFKTTIDANGDWTDPENLGMPINSSADDLGFSLNGKGTLGFVVSNRPGGFGTKSETCCDDIYQVEATKLFLAARGNVMEEKDGARTIAESGIVLLYDEKNGTEMGSYNLINGAYFFDLQPKVNYKLVTRKDGYFDGVASFSTNDNTESDTLKYDLFLKKKVEQPAGNPLIGRVIGRIYYDYDQARLRPDSRDTLRAVMDIMNQFPNFIVEVGAHTDGKGTEDYNVALSKKRAEAAVNYYIYEKKVNKNRLVAKAYGTSQPAASNLTPDGKDNPLGRALNRRTEFKIIGELKPEDKAKEAAKKNEKIETEIAPAKKDNTPVAKVIKRDINLGTTPAKPVTPPVVVPKKDGPKPTSDVYKAAPKESITIKGSVFMEKAGKRSLVNQAAVFLTTNEGGFNQKVFYVKEDGSYSFDLSRSTADTFKLVARKYKFESEEIILLPADVKGNGKPVDLIIKTK